ncbi:MAG: hypothetical protein QM723_05910 [Myxococcaceae bacterium]
MKCNWTQWGQGGTHQGTSCATGQMPNKLLSRIAYDPLSGVEAADTASDEGPELLVHYATPLIVDDDVYVVVKGGHYIPCEPVGSFTLPDGGVCGVFARNVLQWSVKAFHWNGASLDEKWTYDTDWKPVSAHLVLWEPPLQPAVAGDYLWVPGAGGTLDQVERATGKRKKRVDPFNDPKFQTVSGVAASTRGELYYAAMMLDPTDASHLEDARLVKVSYDGDTKNVKLPEVMMGAPQSTDVCHGVFRQPPDQLPFPPVTDAGAFKPPPNVQCGPQRPGISAVPAISADGKAIYFVTRDHLNSRYSFLLAVTDELKPKWTASLRDRLNDGCGVLTPADAVDNPDGGLGDGNRCRAGAPEGVDPETDQQPVARVDDSSSSSPMVLPDGTVLYGAFTTYNTFRGHLMHFGAGGDYLGNYDFGWDVTPAAFAHDGTFSVIVKDNHYFNFDGDAGTFFLTRLDKDLKPEWRFQNTNTMSCHEDGGCDDDHPNGFEWCINAPAVDAQGNVFGNAEDGNLYVIGPDGTKKAQHFLKLAIGAAYTPLAIDSKGRLYALNGGDLFVMGE